MAGFPAPWWVVGGWAVEAFTGCPAVPRGHRPGRLRRATCPRCASSSATCSTCGATTAGPSGSSTTSTPSRCTRSARSGCARTRAPRGGSTAPLNPRRDGLWQSKRDEDLVAELEDVTWVADDGVRYLRRRDRRCYYKALAAPGQGRASTSTNVVAAARRPSEAGLAARDACRRATPDHPWQPRLDGAARAEPARRTLVGAMTDDTVYLDHAASTPMYPEAVAAMTDAARATLGNPSSLHASGRAARRVVEESRETIARALGCRPGEVVFTSGGTESDNLALKGLFWARRDAGPAPHPHPRRRRSSTTPSSTRCTGSPSTRAPRSSCCPSTRSAASTSTPCARSIERDPASGRPGLGDVGQQRGRHRPAGRRGRRARRTRTASPCTPTRCRPSARCRSTSPPRGVDALTLTGAQARRPVRRRRARRAPRARRHRRCCTAAARSATSAPAPSTRPAIAGFAARRRARRRAPARARRPGRRRCATTSSRRVQERCPTRASTATRTGSTHRLPGNAHLDLPRLRGRLAADAARRPRHRVLDRLGLLGRRAAGLPRAARDGLRRRAARAARCGSRSGTPRTAADVDALVEAIGPVVERARAAGAARLAESEARRCRSSPRCPAASTRPSPPPAPSRPGHDVTGIHLALSRNPQSYRTGARGCCTIEDANDARRAADVIGIPFYVWDLSDRFHEDVVEDFMAEYAAGRTPNPCLRCNEKIKFAAVLDRALALGFDAVATGHYAQLRTGADGADRDAPRGRPRQGPVLRARRAHPGAARALAVPARRLRQGRRCGDEADAPRAAGRRQARQPRHLLHRRRRHRRLAAREAGRRRRPRRRDRRPRERRGARPPRRRATASRSASARACGSAGPPPTASRATCSTSSRSPAPSRSGRARRSPSTASRASGRAGAAPRPTEPLHGTVQLRAHGEEHRAVVTRRPATTSSSSCSTRRRASRPARPRWCTTAPGSSAPRTIASTVAHAASRRDRAPPASGPCPATTPPRTTRPCGSSSSELPDLPHLPELPGRGAPRRR